MRRTENVPKPIAITVAHGRCEHTKAHGISPFKWADRMKCELSQQESCYQENSTKDPICTIPGCFSCPLQLGGPDFRVLFFFFSDGQNLHMCLKRYCLLDLLSSRRFQEIRVLSSLLWFGTSAVVPRRRVGRRFFSPDARAAPTPLTQRPRGLEKRCVPPGDSEVPSSL